MSAPDGSVTHSEDFSLEGLVEAGTYTTASDAFQHSLVVLAMGCPCWLVPGDGDNVRLLVEPASWRQAREQLAFYDHESLQWPPRPAPEFAAKPDLLTPVIWSMMLVAVFWAESKQPGWTEAGALDTTAVFHAHEWWRLATALFLHADVNHLLSNALSGIFVFAAVLSLFGRARGWLLIGLSAVAGNLGVALMHHSTAYRSLGASTAIFAALGLLTGAAIRSATAVHPRWRWRQVFVPLAAGFTVLALYGAGGINVDVLAHATGFGAGLVFGFSAKGAAQPVET